MTDVSVGSLLEGAAGEDPIGAAAAAEAGGFLDGFRDPETRAYIERKGFKDVQALGSSFAHLERLVSNDSKRVALPTGETDVDGYERVFTALGRPASAEDYGFGDLAGADPDFSQKAAEWLFEAGVGKARAEALAERWNAYVGERSAVQQQAFEAQSRADWDALRSDWGPAFAENSEHFRRGARTFGVSREEMETIEAGLGTRRTAELFAGIGRGLGEDRFIEGEGRTAFGMSREQAENRIASLRRDQAWQARWMAGGADEKAEWSRLTRIAGAER